MKKAMYVIGALFTLAIINTAGAAEAQDLRIKHTIGLSDDDLLLYRPVDISWSTDGRAYVLNQGDGKILMFSPHWDHLMTFGGQGEGPGKLNYPSMLLVVDDEVWVKVPRGVEIFDLEGVSLRLQEMPYNVTSIKPAGEYLLGTATDQEGVGVRLDYDGTILDVFGPKPSRRQGVLDLALGLSWRVLAGGHDQCALLDVFSGQVWVVDIGTRKTQKIDLGLGHGRVTGSMRFKLAICDACVDPQGGYFVTTYPEKGDPRFLYHFNESWKQDGKWKYPENIWPGVVRVSPRDEICLVEEQSSILYVCERPESR